MGEAHAAVEVRLLHEAPVRHHLVVRGRGHDELAGRLVADVVDGRQPVARPVGPVVAEEGALAVLVGADAKAGGGDAAVVDGEGRAGSGGAGGRKGDREDVAFVAVGERAAGGGGDGEDLHAGGGGGGRRGDAGRFRRCAADQIKRDFSDAVGGEAQRDVGPPGDLVGVVAQGECEDVGFDVDAGGWGRGWRGNRMAGRDGRRGWRGEAMAGRDGGRGRAGQQGRKQQGGKRTRP